LLSIRAELGERIAFFEKHGKLLEAQRLKMRTEYDLEMMEEMGFCSGIENYSRHLSRRTSGSRHALCLIFFQRISCWSLTNHTRLFHRLGVCTRGTDREKLYWSNTASGCPAPWTTGR